MNGWMDKKKERNDIYKKNGQENLNFSHLFKCLNESYTNTNTMMTGIKLFFFKKTKKKNKNFHRLSVI